MMHFVLLFCILSLGAFYIERTHGFVFFPRGGSFGYLAAVAIPLDLPNQNVYMAFNFESNFGLPSNDSYNEWIDRWSLQQNYLGIGNNVTPINGRDGGPYDYNDESKIRQHLTFTRTKFYRSVINYLSLYGLNGTACLLRTICEVNAYNLEETNGLLGSILKVLFIPSTSQPEKETETNTQLYEASEAKDCNAYNVWCPHGLVDMITTTLW